ncbi:bifunctional oligoribonuclease/PAP phosphatase NrnA [bacterium]|nr:bifunctional oligoribonuclease/PAP phosphatase NrnA [bacterium]
MNKLRKTRQLILSAEDIVLACHENPDGDAIGSLVALGLGLKQMGKKVHLISPDGVPVHLSFLTKEIEILNSFPSEDVSLLIIVDGESPQRLGKIKLPSARVTLIIDHHPPISNSSDLVRIVDTTASATGELVYRLLKYLRVDFTLSIVEALLVAILSDTGGLRFPNTTPRTLWIVSALMRLGGNLSEIWRKLYEGKSEGYLKVLGEVLLRVETEYGGRIVMSYIRKDDLERYCVQDRDLEGIVDYLRLLSGWEIIFLFRETPNGVKVNIRSRTIDAGKLAQLFGGGGHKEAAGCTINQSLDNARRIILEELRKWMVC